MKASKSFFVILLLIGCSNEEKPTGRGDDTGSRVVAGRLVYDDQKTASNVIVKLTPSPGIQVRKPAADRISAAADTLYSDTTDQSGKYRFTDIPEGTYTLNAEYVLPGSGDTLLLKPESFTLANSIDLGVDTLYYPGSVSAKAFHDSIPLEDALCYIPGTSYDARTDKSGGCTISGIPPGAYEVDFTAEGYLKERRDGVEVESRRTTPLDTVFLKEDSTLFKGSIAGTVVDASGSPLSGMLIVMSPSGKSTLTDDKGQYVFSDVPNTPQTISLGSTAYAATRILEVTISKDRIVYADTIVAVNVEATKREVRGRLTGNLGKVAGVSIVLHPPSENASIGKPISLGWDKGTERFSGFIQTTKRDSSTPYEILVLDSLSRKIGYYAGTLKSNQGNLEIPDLNAENALPQVVVTGNSLVSIGDTVKLAMSAGDAFNGSILQKEWDIGKTGHFLETVNGDTAFAVPVSFPAGNPDTGAWRFEVIVRVMDDDSNLVEKTFPIMVVKDAPIAIVSEDVFAKVGDTVRFNGIANQSFGKIVRYAWDFDGDGSVDLESAGNGPRNFTYSKAGTYHAVFTVEDDDGNLASSARVVEVLDASAKSPVIKVASSFSHTLFLTLDGTLYAVGANDYGQLANGSGPSVTAPVRVMGDVVDASVQESASFILTKDHKLYGVGRNAFGQLGVGAGGNLSAPALIMEDVAKVSAGRSHALILTLDGEAYSVGSNRFGQLGDGTVVDKGTPVKIMSDVVDIQAGSLSSYFVQADGSAWECGYQSYYQLPDDAKVEKKTPVKILSDVSAIATGDSHTLLLDKHGDLHFKGFDNHFVKFETLDDNLHKLASNVVGMDAGNQFSLFFKADRSLWGVGDNNWGAFGDGTGTSRNVPGPLMPGVSKVFAGHDCAFYIMGDGTLRASGRNEYGQLGDGSTTNRKTPVDVSLP